MGIRALVHQSLAGLLALCSASLAGAQPPAALTGRVTSAAEGAMEGVLVSAKREGSNKTVTVVSHADGAYAFPRDRLEPGRYAVSVRAVKYVLAEPRRARRDCRGGNRRKLDLALRESNPLELALQLTDPEWFASYPLDDRTKWELFRDCSRCHTMRRPSMSTYDAEELAWVMMRMVYSAGSSPMRFQLPGERDAALGPRRRRRAVGACRRRQAEAVASINLHNGMWSYELKTMPRPKGKETEVVYTTWDLPATARPHDTRIAADGTIWFNHFNDNAIGRLDPKTGEVKEWRWPYRAKEGSFQPTGARTLMGPGRARPLVHRQSGAKRRRRVRSEDRAIRVSRSAGRRRDDRRLGRARRRQGVARRRRARSRAAASIKSISRRGQHTEIKGTNEKPLYAYDIAADSRNNVYGSARGAPYVWRIDAKTHDVSVLRHSGRAARRRARSAPGMRRGITDSQDRLWWGGYDGGFIGMLDPRKPAGQQMKLYAVPFPYFFPYDAHYDEQGYTWTGGIYADRVARMNVETGEWNFYLLPFEANIRDINLQPAARDGLSGLWIGHTHQAMITLVEPLAR